jgi:hypothetical protein
MFALKMSLISEELNAMNPDMPQLPVAATRRLQ